MVKSTAVPLFAGLAAAAVAGLAGALFYRGNGPKAAKPAPAAGSAAASSKAGANKSSGVSAQWPP